MAGSVDSFLSDNAQARSRRRKLIISIIVGAVILHLAFGLFAGVWVIARYLMPPPATFEVKKDIRLPAKQREHRMNMAAFDAMTPKPTFNDKMQSLRPAPFSLPELPKVPMDQMLPLDPAAIVSDQVSSLVGTAGTGGGGQGAGGLGGLGTGFSFMGIKSQGKRILLLFDVSSSVTNKAARSGVPLEKIQEETLALLQTLPISARFGIIQFTQNYKAFSRELLPATDQNREAARKWITDEWVTTGMMAASSKVTTNPRGLVGVLELAAKMQPDVIFLISDGSFQWRESGNLDDIPWPEVKKVVKSQLESTSGCRLNFIGFEMKQQDRSEMGSIARSTGGKLREIK
jgi:hypothetical protein